MAFAVYKRFYKKDEAAALTDILGENGIRFEIVEDRDNLDSLYGDKQFSLQYFVKIDSSNFEKADSVISKMSEIALDKVDKDHYLFTFTDDELFEIVCKPDEWSSLDNQLAKKILKERGKEINQHTIDLLKKQRVAELAKPEQTQKMWIYGGYLFALLGGFLGIMIGWHLSSHTKTLPNGQQVYGYSKEDREHGRIIWILGIVMFVIWLVIRFSLLARE